MEALPPKRVETLVGSRDNYEIKTEIRIGGNTF